MKTLFVAAILVGLVSSGTAGAALLYSGATVSETLRADGGWCSPCGTQQNLNYRVFTPFTLRDDSILSHVRFNSVFRNGWGDLNVQLLSTYSDFETRSIFNQTFSSAEYDVFEIDTPGSPDINYIVSIDLGHIELAAGTYYFSPFAEAGTLELPKGPGGGPLNIYIRSLVASHWFAVRGPVRFEIHGDLASVVPIPAAAYLFGSALLGLGALKRKKAQV